MTLIADIIFVNNLPFLMTLSRNIRFITVEHVKSRSAKQLCISLIRVLCLYGRAGLTVQTMLMDMEADKISDSVVGNVVVNTTAAKEHVAEIERLARTVKERGRCVVSQLPFSCLPKLIVVNIIYHVALWLNAFPCKLGISKEFSPRAIVLRTNLDVSKHAPFSFGQYVQTTEEPELSNSMQPRTAGGIFVGCAGNIQGSLKVFMLETCKVVKRCAATPLDMPQKVIDRVNQIGKRTRQEVYGKDLEFLNRTKDKFEWDLEDDMDEMLEASVPPEPADFPATPIADTVGGSRAVEPEATAFEDMTEQEKVIASLANHPTAPVEGTDRTDPVVEMISGITDVPRGALDADVDTRNDELDASVDNNAVEEADESQERTDESQERADESQESAEETPAHLGRGKRNKTKPDRFGKARYNKQTKRYESTNGKKVYAQTKKGKGADDVTVKTSNRSRDRKWKKKPRPTKKGVDATPCRTKRHPRPRLGGKV